MTRLSIVPGPAMTRGSIVRVLASAYGERQMLRAQKYQVP